MRRRRQPPTDKRWRLLPPRSRRKRPRLTKASTALEAFKKGDYPNALQLDQQALQKSPQDPVMHEVAALCMFATGDYTGAAAVLNNLLAVRPAWTGRR